MKIISVPRGVLSHIERTVAAVQNTWYELPDGDTLKNVDVDAALFNMLTANEDIEFRLIIDGTTYAGSQAPAVANTRYWTYISLFTDGTILAYATTSANQILGLTVESVHCKTFQLQIKKTTAAGANNLRFAILYHQF